MSRKKKKDLSCGLDESNHGMPLEIVVGVFSTHQSDGSMHKSFKSSNRKKGYPIIFNTTQEAIDVWTKTRDYRFTVVPKKELLDLPSHKWWGVLLCKLIPEELLENTEVLRPIIDGPLSGKERNYLRDAICQTTGFPRRRISVRAGANCDRGFYVVNLADQIARFLYRNYSNRDLQNHPQYVNYDLKNVV